MHFNPSVCLLSGSKGCSSSPHLLPLLLWLLLQLGLLYRPPLQLLQPRTLDGPSPFIHQSPLAAPRSCS